MPWHGPVGQCFSVAGKGRRLVVPCREEGHCPGNRGCLSRGSVFIDGLQVVPRFRTNWNGTVHIKQDGRARPDIIGQEDRCPGKALKGPLPIHRPPDMEGRRVLPGIPGRHFVADGDFSHGVARFAVIRAEMGTGGKENARHRQKGQETGDANERTGSHEWIAIRDNGPGTPEKRGRTAIGNPPTTMPPRFTGVKGYGA